MRKETLFILSLSFLLLLQYSGYSQETPVIKIDDNFNNISFIDFLNRLEKKTSYRFYYNPVQLDTLTLQLDVKGLTLKEALQLAFKNTDILFSIDSSNQVVFISTKNAVITELPKGYFPGTFNQYSRDTETTVPITDYETESSKVTRGTEGKLVVIGKKGLHSKGNAIVTGYIRNSNTGEPLNSVSVFMDSLHATISDVYGHYSLAMPVGSQRLNIQSIGMRDVRLQLTVYSDGNLDIDMNEQIQTLKEVVVSSRKTTNIRNVQMGVE